MRPQGQPPLHGSERRYGTAALICSVGAWCSWVVSIIPIVGCLATPLGFFAALAGVVLGVLAIIEGRKQQDSVETFRGGAAVVVGLAMPLLVGVMLYVFKDKLVELFEMTGHGLVGAPPTADGGVPLRRR